MMMIVISSQVRRELPNAKRLGHRHLENKQRIS